MGREAVRAHPRDGVLRLGLLQARLDHPPPHKALHLWGRSETGEGGGVPQKCGSIVGRGRRHRGQVSVVSGSKHGECRGVADRRRR